MIHTGCFQLFNYIEIVLWFAFGLGLLLKANKLSKRQRILAIIAGIAFFLFAVSDIIETYTGAWWKPTWLLIIKCFCIIIFAFCFISYKKMKNINCLALIFISFIITPPYNPIQAEYNNLKKNLAIIDFDNKTTFKGLGRGAQDILTTALWETDRFILLEREEIQKIFHEQALSLSGRVPTETAIKIGRILGAQYILTGGITEAGLIKGGSGNISRIVLDARLIDVDSSQIVLAETASGTAPGNNLDAAIRVASENLVKKINKEIDKKPWQSSVMKVTGEIIHINAGSEHGIQKSNQFAVYQKGEEFIDPRTKAVLGSLSNKIGAITIVEVHPDYSIAKPIKGTGFEKGNVVKEE